MNKLKNIQPLHNASVVPSIASEFGEKELQGENSLHTSPDSGTIPALCKVGGASQLEKSNCKKIHQLDKPIKIYVPYFYSVGDLQVIAETEIMDSELESRLSMGNHFIKNIGGKLDRSFIDTFISKGGKPPQLRLDNVIDS